MSSTTGPVRVLHVAEDAASAERTAESLEFESDALGVETATSVREGLDRLADAEFDCVVSDYEMPETDGIEFLRRVRERHGDLPFVLFTDDGSEAVASEAISAGVTEYLRKRAGTDQYAVLTSRIESAVESRRARHDYRQLFEKASDGMLVYDPDTGDIVEANERVTDVLGYDAETLLDMEIADFSADDPRFTQDEATDRIRAAADGATSEFEWPAETSDGTEVWLRLESNSAVVDGRERVLVVRGVSDRKQYEQELDFFGRLVETLGVGIAVYGENGRFRYVNAAYASLFDTDPEALEGAEVWAVNPDVERERFDDYWASFDEGETRTSETRHEFDGVSVTVQTVTTRETIRGTSYHFGIVQDITQRREREREWEVRSAAMEASIDGMAILDENEAYRFVNDAHAEVYGYEDPDALLGESWRTCYSDEELERLEDEVLPVLAEDGAWRGEALGQRADGSTFPQEISLSTTATGEIVCVVRDVTDRVERERELERQNERLDEFASIASHDLRNPLNVATGRLELARNDDRDDREDHLDAVANAHDRMEALLEDLLALTRSDASESVETVSLAATADRGWRSVETDDATLAVKTDRTVRATESRLQQLFENLFRNAVEHGGDDVTVTVGAIGGDGEESESDGYGDESRDADGVADEPRGTDESRDADEPRDADGFYVEDDGPGVPGDEREKVFEDGYSTDDGGTGLGLSIVEQIATTHGWDVSLTRGTDGGARIEVTQVAFV